METCRGRPRQETLRRTEKQNWTTLCVGDYDSNVRVHVQEGILIHGDTHRNTWNAMNTSRNYLRHPDHQVRQLCHQLRRRIETCRGRPRRETLRRTELDHTLCGRLRFKRTGTRTRRTINTRRYTHRNTWNGMNTSRNHLGHPDHQVRQLCHQPPSTASLGLPT